MISPRHSHPTNGVRPSDSKYFTTDVNNLLIPFPPIGLQREFVAIANAAEASKAELKKSITSIDAVMRGLINRR